MIVQRRIPAEEIRVGDLLCVEGGLDPERPWRNVLSVVVEGETDPNTDIEWGKLVKVEVGGALITEIDVSYWFEVCDRVLIRRAAEKGFLVR